MTKSMTEGKPIRLIIGFAFPLFLGMLFQQFYSMVDTIIVGKFLGVEPLAGVGATGCLNFLVLGFCMGICNGFAIPIAQMFGAKKERDLRKYTANSAWLCITFAAVITTLVVIFCRPLLTLLNTPENIFEYSYTYIVIIFCGIPCTILYNMLAAILRSLGDSKTPLIFLAISSVINIGLDILFIVVLHTGVEGPAMATVISQGLSGMICFFYMKKKFAILKISKEEWKPKLSYVKNLCFVGIPMGLQYSITAIGSLVITSALNGFGAVAVAGVTTAQKIANFIVCPIEALGQTMAPYCGQNVGAGKLDRVGKGVKAASLCGFVVSAVLFVIVVLFGRQLSMLFLDKPNVQVMDYAYRYMKVCASGYCLLVLVNVVRFAIQGMGFSIFAITAGVMEMLARTLAGTVGVKLLGFTGICTANVLAWIFADAFLLPAFFYCRNRMQHIQDRKNNTIKYNHSLFENIRRRGIIRLLGHSEQ